ncbi:hypothetical protein H310_08203 [Aphanomyces invadans]|uniref:HIG1 domain-containing protein n=1 Tax=Aphanomyces invadans TaxID=157072 RepID=A0A024TZF0_9STRA|nr:hypothetical protein H310_08203 [Aphanomyces invadans]ETV99540.1 hypothetical protein H310_08203 [Aphanomyces invadans]RHY23004.1 hypothetical protein DYB32_009331 [Aphanomyces invadans]|eukprot:XP_008872096.1 hypothetical protein H310_08203 [Aphanomyces invadans]
MNQESGVDKLKRKFMENPFVPVGALLTTVVLVGGMRTFMVGGDSRTQQRYMRARVVAQGATVVAVAAGSVLYDKNSVGRKWLRERGIFLPGDDAEPAAEST